MMTIAHQNSTYAKRLSSYMKIRILICFFLFISLRGYSQCTLTVALSQSSPAICSGTGVVLTATPSGGTPPYSYSWSTGEKSASITVNKAGNYTVTVSDKTPGCTPVKQSITVVAGTTPDAPTAKKVTVCSGSAATLTATAPGGTYQWYDASGNFLASGDTYVTPPITSATTFYVQTTIGGCTSAQTAVNVSVTGRPAVTGATVCAGSVATLMASGGDTYTWYDAAKGGNTVGSNAQFTTPPLNTTTTYYVVATINGCTSARTPVVATVSQPPPPPTASNQTICSGSSANLHADAPAGVFDWYTTPTGGTSLISSPDYTTPPLTANATYYVQTTTGDCASPRTPVKVFVDSPPIPPDAQTTTICYNTSATLTASANPAGTYKWYDAPANGKLLYTGITYTTPQLTTSASYYVQAVNGTCVSTLTQKNVIVNPLLPAPSVAGAIICSGSIATLTATSAGGTYQWFAAATGGVPLANTATYTTPALRATATYYVQRLFQGCVSPRIPVMVTVLPLPATPAAPNVSVCAGSPATLTANSPTNNYAWYDSPTGGTLLSTGQVYVTPPLIVNTTYYVESSDANGCTSARKAVTVNINPNPAAPTASNASICYNTPATLTAAAAAGTVQWYDTPVGGTLLKTGNTYTTPALTAATTYYIQAVSGTCTSSRTAVTVSIIPGYNPQFQYSSGTYCVTAANPTPVINNPSGGTFSADLPGLKFVSTTTGEINIAASIPGKYVVSFTGNGTCAGTAKARIAIVTTTNATFSYAGPYCQSGADPLPTYGGIGTPGVFTASPAGLVFKNTSTGEIDLANSQAGTYKVTNTIAASGTCAASTATANVTIYRQVFVNAGPDQTVPSGTPVQLNGSIGGGGTSGTWSGGTGTFSNPNILNPIYTPGPGEKAARLILKSDDPPGPCGPQLNSVVITFNASPTAPVASGTSICAGSTATLSATAPGGTYQWYDANTGGSLLATGPSFKTLPLVANTTYYVQTTINGITSTRTAVTVTVNAIPTAPTAPSVQTCAGTVATLTAGGPAGSTYAWYDAAIGGNKLSTKNTYTTPVLNFNTSYYVQAQIGNCISPRTQVDVTLTPVPNVTSAISGSVCSGNAQNYAITSDVPTATFTWSRAAVVGISNTPVTNQTSSNIAETLINTTGKAINVTYVITPLSGTCSGPAFNYVVTVYPLPAVTSSATPAAICNATSSNYAITFNTPGTTFTWARAAVAGISNAAVSGQTASVIREVLFNTTNAPINVTYVINYKTSTCTATPFNVTITVNPTAIVTSSSSNIACSGQPEGYLITSNIPTATFSWSRPAVGTNPAVFNNTSPTINETLTNTGNTPLTAIYTIIPIANGCNGTPFLDTVSINPTVFQPVAHNNSPVCVGSNITLLTPTVANATYLWTGPNGYTSTDQNPVIGNATTAESGVYTLTTTIRGCTSPPATTTVEVDEPSTAVILNPSNPFTVCKLAPVVSLKGQITGGTSTTGQWSTSGNGTFVPAIDALDAQYLFTPEDKANGSVVLTLATTSKSDCSISTASVTIQFGPLPAVNAGTDQSVCSQDAAVKLNGTNLTPGNVVWSSPDGTGNFNQPNQLSTYYNPSAADIKKGSVQMVLTNSSAGECFIPSDTVTIKFIPPPTLNAGGTRYVLRGNTITLTPTVSDNDVTYLWSPNIDINDVTARNPVITGDINRAYILTVTDSRGCQTTDTTFVIVSPEIKVNNAFTPNGDGINDLWEITGLVAYTNATVDIFNRFGTKLFHSIGYPKAWDGTYDGKPVPTGVYYYIIDTKVNNQVLSGYVTVIR